MNQTTAAYEQIIEKYVRWAMSDPGTRAAIIIGSRARADHPADEWSDLDIIVHTSDMQRYLATTDWLEHIGTPWLTFVEQTPGGGPERRVMFEGGLDVDFAIIPAEWSQQVMSVGIPPDLADIIRRGVRVIVDKDGLAAQLLQMPVTVRQMVKVDAQWRQPSSSRECAMRLQMLLPKVEIGRAHV